MSQNPPFRNVLDNPTNRQAEPDPDEALFRLVLQQHQALAELVESSDGSAQMRRSINREVLLDTRNLSMVISPLSRCILMTCFNDDFK